MRSVGHSRSAGVAALLMVSSLITISPAVALPGGQESPAQALGKIRSMAESQHEIVLLLIRKKDFAQAEAEACKIFDMNWPANEEPLLLKELLFLSDQFLREGQPAAGIRLLDSSMRAFKSSANQAAVWKEKGYLYKSMRDNDKALECFRTAQRLEQTK
jgi:tetratricopeptide (TPR) repeat protein